jgi:hypothetical protein
VVEQTVRDRFAVYYMIVPDEVEAWVLGYGDCALGAVVLVQGIDMRSSPLSENVEIRRQFVEDLAF